MPDVTDQNKFKKNFLELLIMLKHKLFLRLRKVGIKNHI